MSILELWEKNTRYLISTISQFTWTWNSFRSIFFFFFLFTNAWFVRASFYLDNLNKKSQLQQYYKKTEDSHWDIHKSRETDRDLVFRLRIKIFLWACFYYFFLDGGWGQEYWSGLPFPSPADFPKPGSNPGLLNCGQTLYHLSHQGSHSRPWKGLTSSFALGRPL